VHGKFARCQFHWEMERARRECQIQLQRESHANAGCRGEWDNVLCWQSAAVGEVTTLPCPSALQHLFGRNGNLSRTCTEAGWSDVQPDMLVTCWSDDIDETSELLFYRVVKVLATLGYSLSLVALLASTFIVCFFRRLHCTRNYIHLNLFVSFMLRAVAVLAKDALLFSDDETTDCSTQPSLMGCKAVMVLFNYFVMANFFWLLVEGLYLHTLLLIIRHSSIRLSVYMLIGWGIPFVFTLAWVICRINLEDTGCWEKHENPVLSRLIHWPIMASVIINFILFISIIRILVQKLRCTDVEGNKKSQFRRLAKSTLLLVALFGINYVVFVYTMEPSDMNLRYAKIFFDVGLGSFQGLIVAILYCFLNSEVQSELRRMWRSLSLKRYMGQDDKMLAVSA
uniref:Vasoactive intestinal peptide receptor 2 n=1 Tax=Tetraodon nigroviridis TaxID=99883 RepID=H3CTH0_TETNG